MCELPKNIKNVYFMGIGGIGMSALARYFLQSGCEVSGYDRTSSALTLSLESEGMKIHYAEDPSKISEDIDLLVYTPAVSKTNSEWKIIREMNIPCMKRAEVLGNISRSKKTLALAGTHGKTSITSLTSLILRSNEPVTAFIGGIASNFNSNLVNDKAAKVMIIEADEFDRSFLNLNPDIAVVSAIDADHLDIYHTKESLYQAFDQFSCQIKEGGCLITKPELSERFTTKAKIYTYSMADATADFVVSNLRIAGGSALFDINTPSGVLREVVLNTPGLYNVENALAAVAVACLSGVPEEKIKSSLCEYKGVKRRFEYIIRNKNIIYIDDYAHHPKEIKACIESARAWYPERKICGVFQPHLYTRTRDFADAFAEELSALDSLVLLDIYPAREEPLAGIDSKMLLDKVKLKNKYLCSKGELIPLLEKLHPEVLITMGAGDIDRLVEKIKTAFAYEN